MKVFVSWSGDVSHQVALALRDWLPSVIQSLDPYVSSKDIDKGARWATDIGKELEVSHFGILCVTPDNVEAPWLNFEAGALSKSIDKSRVVPFLVGLKFSDIKSGPLLQFQATLGGEKDDVEKLMQSLNNACDPRNLDEARVKEAFGVWWPRLEEKIQGLLARRKAPSKPGADAEKPVSGTSGPILEELLTLARNQYQLLNTPERLLPLVYLRAAVGRVPETTRPETHFNPELAFALRRLRHQMTRVTDPKSGMRLEDVQQLFEALVSMEAKAARATGNQVSMFAPPAAVDDAPAAEPKS